MVVAQRVDRDATQAVQVFLAVDVPDSAALTAGQCNGHAAIGVHHVGRSCLNESGHAEISRRYGEGLACGHEPEKRDTILGRG
ncbi:hypothetical protein D3C71_2107920 [compost metagenome]